MVKLRHCVEFGILVHDLLSVDLEMIEVIKHLSLTSLSLLNIGRKLSRGDLVLNRNCLFKLYFVNINVLTCDHSVFVLNCGFLNLGNEDHDVIQDFM